MTRALPRLDEDPQNGTLLAEGERRRCVALEVDDHPGEGAVVPGADGPDVSHLEKQVADDLLSESGAVDIDDEALGVPEPEGIIGVDFFFADDNERETIPALDLDPFDDRAGECRTDGKNKKRKKADHPSRPHLSSSPERPS